MKDLDGDLPSYLFRVIIHLVTCPDYTMSFACAVHSAPAYGSPCHYQHDLPFGFMLPEPLSNIGETAPAMLFVYL